MANCEKISTLALPKVKNKKMKNKNTHKKDRYTADKQPWHSNNIKSVLRALKNFRLKYAPLFLLLCCFCLLALVREFHLIFLSIVALSFNVQQTQNTDANPFMHSVIHHIVSALWLFSFETKTKALGERN